MHIKLLAALAALAFITPTVALAQDAPSYAQPAGPPVAEDGQIQGRISSFDGGYNLIVQDDRGYADNVQLHDGTIINPTGLTLAPGMVVSILGYNEGPYFAANEVDTPYTYYAACLTTPDIHGASTGPRSAWAFSSATPAGGMAATSRPAATITSVTRACTTTCA